MAAIERRDRRQFKGAPYQNPKAFPPPAEETWLAIGAAPPARSGAAAAQTTRKARKAKERK